MKSGKIRCNWMFARPNYIPLKLNSPNNIEIKLSKNDKSGNYKNMELSFLK